MTMENIIFYIIVPLCSALLGGGLTLIGVLISIKHENKKIKKEKIESKKPLIYLINRMQDYDYEKTETFYFKNNEFESTGVISIVLKNTDNGILVLDNIEIENDIYYPSNGTVIDKNTIFNICTSVNKNAKININTKIVLTIKDSIGTLYKYKLGLKDEKSTYIDTIEEIK